MKKITFILLCLAWLFPIALQAQTATPPAGSGTASDPYQVASLDNLYWVSKYSSTWDKYFIQTADINASATAAWNNNAGFSPIGNDTTPFTGSYDGQGSIIDSITISRSTTNNIGLFGKIDGGVVKNLGIDDANITGKNYVGILAGVIMGDTALIDLCFTSGTVTGNNMVGGCVGNNIFPATLKNSGSTASVTANNLAGGLAGSNSSTINNCYASGAVTAHAGAGGLVGGNSQVTNSFWDTQTSGQTASSGGTGKTTTEMKSLDTYTNTATTGLTTAWDFLGTPGNDADTLDYWNMDTTGSFNNGYPVPSWRVCPAAPAGTGTQSDPYQIASLNNLYWMSEGDGTSVVGQNKYFEQIADIPAKSTEYIHKGQGFNPIGIFRGHYNGGNHTITNLYMKRGENVGLFGRMTDGEISNLGILNANITCTYGDGYEGVGILVGNIYNFEGLQTKITNCYASGTVTSHGYNSGGLVGRWNRNNNDFMRNSHFTGTVTTTGKNVGGLIGILGNTNGTVTIENCYAVADCNGNLSNGYGGGLIGYVYFMVGHLTINSSYSSGSVSAQYEGGLVGFYEMADNFVIHNCYSRSDLASGAQYAGGLVGKSGYPLEITNSYSTGTATGGTYSGGMVGQYSGTFTATACFWDTLTSGNGVATGNATQPAGMTGKTTTEMKTQSTFTGAGWDFTDVWDMDGTTNDGYAFLRMKSAPAVSTADPYNIGADTAQSGGLVTFEGSLAVTAKGVVWDTTDNPTLTSHLGMTNEGNGSGSFTSTLTGLSDTTFYYVRAYATNNIGTDYGDVKTFTTLISEPPAMNPPGNALDFDGSDDYVSLPNESNFDFTDSMTIAAWIKVDAFDEDWQAIISKGGDDSWRLQRYGSTNHIDFGTSGLSNQDLEGTTDVNDGNWHYIAGVFDGSAKYIYVDGNLDASARVTGTIATTNDPVEIGANSQHSDRNFDGLIDEVRIWNVARTQNQIQGYMNNVLTGNEIGLTAYYKFDVDSGNVLYDYSGNYNIGRLHNMDDNDWVASGWPVGTDPTFSTKDAFNIGTDTAQSGGQIYYPGSSPVTAKGVVWNTTGNPTLTNNLGSTNDGSGSGSFTSTLTGLSDTTVYYVRAYFTNGDGTKYGDEKTFYTQMPAPATMAPPGNALDFDGTDDYVSLPNEHDFDFTDSLTVAAWIKVDAFTTDWQAIVTKGDGAWRLQRSGGTNHIDFGTSGLSNGDLEGTTDVADGNWHYIAGVYDGSTKYLYVDGNLDASASVTGTIAITDDTVEIGANSNTGNKNFDGQIDEVRIWNVARTQNQIQGYMNNVLTGNESGLVAYYKFDDTSGTYLYDYSDNGRLGKLHNMHNNDWVASGWPVDTVPTVNTTEVSNIGSDTAQSGGTVVGRGASPITAEGVVWNTAGNPDLTNNLGKTNDGTALGSFTSTLTGLKDTTVYYVRAYATNSDGTGYGEVKSFVTKMGPPTTMTPPGNALDFDGTDDYVLLPNEADFDFTSAMTVAAWIKVDAFTTEWQGIVTKGGDNAWRLQRYGNTNHIEFGTTGLSNMDLEGSTDVADGNWHYIAGVYDGYNKYLYVDGNIDAAAYNVTGTISTTNDTVEIGAAAQYSNRNFNGLIDEVRIWNVARSHTEIQNNMNKVLTGNENGLVAYYKFDMFRGTYLYDHSGNGHTGRLHNMASNDWVTSGWTAQGETTVNTTDVYDITTNTAKSGGTIVTGGSYPITAKGVVWDTIDNPDLTHNIGKTNEGSATGTFTSTLTGLSDTTVYYVRAYVTNIYGTAYGDVKSFTTKMSSPPAMNPPGNALDFDGTDDYVVLSDENGFDFTNAMTVAAWIKVNSFTEEWQAIVTKGNGAWRLQRFWNTDHIDFGTTGLSNQDLEGTTNVNDGNWHYVAGVFDGTKKYLYVDGNLDDSVSVTGSISTTDDEVEIGANSNGNSKNFDGLIDEVRIWNVARTQTELNYNMHIVLSGNETGLVAYYKFDVSSGTYLYDHTGNDHLGKLHNMNNSDWVTSGWPLQLKPLLNTTDAFDIGVDTAKSGGVNIYEGASSITAKGVVWNTSGNPDLSNNLGSTNDGSGTDAFTSTLTGLSDTTVYYVRAYATNSDGTGYGEAKSFNTMMSEPAAMTPPGNALDFDGTDDYVSLPNESNFDFTDSLTVAAWIKVDAFTAEWQAIINKGGDDSWRLQRYGNTNHIDFGTTGLSNQDLEGTTDVADGNWHYIAGVYDGSTKYLYVDGNLDTSVSVTATIITTDTPVEIGANSQHAERNFDGQIDEVRIWNSPRTQTQLQNNMNKVLTGNESGLVAYYKFDVSSGTYLYDHTGNNNLGRLHNMANNDWVASGWPVSQTATWTGAVNNDWNNAGNWSGINGVPSSIDDVEIPNVANQPVIQPGDTVQCHKLTVETGASVTLASDATGHGTLIVTGK